MFSLSYININYTCRTSPLVLTICFIFLLMVVAPSLPPGCHLPLQLDQKICQILWPVKHCALIMKNITKSNVYFLFVLICNGEYFCEILNLSIIIYRKNMIIVDLYGSP